jgi:hypothetical protein
MFFFFSSRAKAGNFLFIYFLYNFFFTSVTVSRIMLIFLSNVVVTLSTFSSAKHANASFNVVISGLLTPTSAVHDLDLLAEFCRVLVPQGTLVVQEMVGEVDGTAKTSAKLISLLKLSGFVDIAQVSSMLRMYV